MGTSRARSWLLKRTSRWQEVGNFLYGLPFKIAFWVSFALLIKPPVGFYSFRSLLVIKSKPRVFARSPLRSRLRQMPCFVGLNRSAGEAAQRFGMAFLMILSSPLLFSDAHPLMAPIPQILPITAGFNGIGRRWAVFHLTFEAKLYIYSYG